MSDTSVTTAQIYKKLFTDYLYSKKSADIVENIFFVRDHFESDFIAVTQAGYITEIEIKVSRSDFKADFKKSHRRWDFECSQMHYDSKHDLIKKGAFGLKYFYFAAPRGLLRLEEIPGYAGLMEIHEGPHGHIIRTVLKKAPALPKFKKITTARQAKIEKKYKNAYIYDRAGS